MAQFFYIANLIIFSYFGLLAICYTILLVAAIPDIFKKYKEVAYGNVTELMSDVSLPPVTIIVPMYNEAKRILNCVLSILHSDYKNFEIILVNDASTDDTLKLLVEKFNLVETPIVFKDIIKTAKVLSVFKSKTDPLTVINKEHGHSADSINVGLNACKTPLYISLDADTVIEPDALSKIVYTILSNPHCVSVGGALYVLNNNEVRNGVVLEKRIPKTHLLPAAQALEYLRSFMFGRSGWNTFGGALCYAGAFTLFETQAVREVGGYDNANYSYDVEILLALHNKFRLNKFPYSVHYTPDPAAWTEVPQTIKSFWKQRERWQLGTIRSFMRFKSMFFNSRYGVVGFFTYPFYLLFEILGPVMEAVSYILLLVAIVLGLVTGFPLVWALLLAWGFLSVISIIIIILNNITFHKYNKIYDVLSIFLLVVVEMLGVRQLRAVCAMYSTIKYMVYPRSRRI